MSSETSDTDEVMKELEPESDNAMEEEERNEVRDNEQDNPSVRQEEGFECRNDRRWKSRHVFCLLGYTLSCNVVMLFVQYNRCLS